MELIMHLSFYIAEILLGIPCGYIMFKNRHIDDEKIIGRNNMISNIFFFIIVGVAIAGCVVLQINYNGWWNIFTLFTTGLLSCYLFCGLIKGIFESNAKNGKPIKEEKKK